MKWLALVFVAACASNPGLDGELTGPIEFTIDHAIAGELPVAGLDTDGSGGLWIGYVDGRITHVAADGTKLFEYATDGRSLNGLAAAGDTVWFNTGNRTGLAGEIVAIDAMTGAEKRRFATESGVMDLDAFGDEVRYSVVWDRLVGLDAQSGGERWDESTGFKRYVYGLASMADDLVWFANGDNRLYLTDPKHGVLGSGEHHLLDYRSANLTSQYLAWDGEHVIIATNGQITWLTPMF